LYEGSMSCGEHARRTLSLWVVRCTVSARAVSIFLGRFLDVARASE
jgi:hypothetical protein